MLVVVLALLALAVAAAGPGKVLTVGPGRQYATIQAAVDAAKPGSSILVYPDTYTESVSVTKNDLKIIAQNGGVIVLPPDTAGFQVAAYGVTIQGFNIEFGVNCAAGILFEGSRNTFADNSIRLYTDECMGAEAIVSADADGGSDNNLIERNTVDGGAQGITIRTDAINTGNIIRDNSLLSLDTIPIAIVNGKGFLVSGNRIIGASIGICIAVSAQGGNGAAQGYHTIVKNTVRDCFLNGISLRAWPGTSLSHNRIAENDIQGCGEDCLLLQADSGAALTNNEVISNSVSFSLDANGLLLSAEEDGVVSDNLIRDNLIYRNEQSGISLTSGADRNKILNNEVQDNNNIGISVSGDDNLIVGNWSHDNSLDHADYGEGNKWRNNTYDPPQVGWAIGYDMNDAPAIVHTTDGGLTWQVQGDLPITWASNNNVDISAVDDLTAWAAVGSGVNDTLGAILHTTDGGETWVAQFITTDLAGGIKAVKGLSRNEAWAASLGGTILHTTDGGLTWNVVPHPNVTIVEVNRIDAIGKRDVWIADVNGGNTFMIHTQDNGLTWRQESLPDVGPSQGVIAVSAYSPLVVWSGLNASGVLYRTVDGGTQWDKLTPSGIPAGDWDDMCAGSQETLWGVHTLGYEAGTINRVHVARHGRVDSQSFQPVELAYSYEGITCLDEQIVWVVGFNVLYQDLPKGVILSTMDGGETWVRGSAPTDIYYWKVSFVGARR